jgi:hypothetical protein
MDAQRHRIPMHARKSWSDDEVAELSKLVRNGDPMRVMKNRLGRSQASIVGRLQKMKREENRSAVLSVKDWKVLPGPKLGNRRAVNAPTMIGSDNPSPSESIVFF